MDIASSSQTDCRKLEDSLLPASGKQRLLLISVFPPFAAPEANHAYFLSEQLAESGIEVHVLCQQGAAKPKHPNVRIHPLMKEWSFAEMLRVRRVLADSKPGAVLLLYLGWIYGQSMAVTVLPSVVRLFAKDVPFITQFEAIESKNIKQPALRALARRLLSVVTRRRFHMQLGYLLRGSNQIIALSEPHKKALAAEDPLSADRITVMPPPPLIRMSAGGASATRSRVRAELGLRRGEFAFMFWGHIYPGKGLDTLLLAFERVSRNNASARLIVVGGALEISKGENSAALHFLKLRQLPDKLGTANAVKWTGPFEWNSERGSEWLRAADACVVPLDWGVTLNNSTLAAAARHELPIIATSAEENADPALVHGHSAYLCRPLDPNSLAEGMIAVMHDGALREKLRLGSRALAGEWHSWPVVAARMARILEKAREDAASPSDQESSMRPPRAFEQKAIAALPPSRKLTSNSGKRQGKPLPRVSVILAVYNVENYLPQCLDSLVSQTLSEIEVIAIDDASTDGSLAILKRYSARHSTIRVVALESNVGLASVRNVGLDHAKGEYIVFLDGDDWADVRMCETLYEVIRTSGADLVSASATVFYDDKKTFAPLFDNFMRKRISAFAKRFCFSIAEEPRALLLELVAWSKIYRRSFLTEHRIRFESGFNSYEDMCFHVKSMLRARNIRVIDDPVVFYRQSRPGQISAMTGRSKYQIFDIFRIINEDAALLDVPGPVWGQIIRIQIRHFDWMLNSRVWPHESRRFFSRMGKCFRAIPSSAWSDVKYIGVRDAAQAIAMRRGWHGVYKLVSRRSTLPARLLCLTSYRVLAGGSLIKTDYDPGAPSSLPALPHQAPGQDGSDAIRIGAAVKLLPTTSRDDARVRVHAIRGQQLLIADTGSKFGLEDDVWRVEHDHFLSQLCSLRPGDSVIDIGAGVGVWALHFAMKFPRVTVYAIEPDKHKFAYLRRNIALNAIGNVRAINAAISPANGSSRLFTGSNGEIWSTLNETFARRKNSFAIQNVRTCTLPWVFSHYGIRECRLLKIDAWGSVRSLLDRFPPSIRIDFLCGECDADECDESYLGVTSARVARQYFWRTWRETKQGKQWSHVHRLPGAI